MANFTKIINLLDMLDQPAHDTRRMSYRDCYVNPHPELDEYIARDRRLTHFESVDGLAEVLDIESQKHQSLGAAIKGSLDHTSFWIFHGMPIVMTEPYSGELRDYQTQGLAAVELPDEIAPYCGFWDPTPNAKPRTKTFLITNVVSERKLQRLLQILKEMATHMPPWNQV